MRAPAPAVWGKGAQPADTSSSSAWTAAGSAESTLPCEARFTSHQYQRCCPVLVETSSTRRSPTAIPWFGSIDSAAPVPEHRVAVIEGQADPDTVTTFPAHLALPVDDASTPPEPSRHEPRRAALHPQTARRSGTGSGQVPPPFERTRPQRTSQRVPDPVAALAARERVLVRRCSGVGVNEEPQPRRRDQHRASHPLRQRRLPVVLHAPRMPALPIRATRPGARGPGGASYAARFSCRLPTRPRRSRTRGPA